MKYLKLSNTIEDFIDWNLEIRNYYWQIRDEDIKNRKKEIEHTEYFDKLNKLAQEQEINFNDAEIISWLDSMAIMEETLKRISFHKNYHELKINDKVYHKNYREGNVIEFIDDNKIVKILFSDGYHQITNSNKYLQKFSELQFNEFNKISIVQELHIPFTNKRADFVLFKDNKILIIEFSFAKWDTEYRYEHKLNQAIGYKECLENILPSHIEIATYTFIIKPETSYEWNFFPYNRDNIENLKNFIINFFSNTKKDAFTELSKIQTEL